MRVENWLDRLAEVIAKHDAMPFAYGVSDCAILVRDVVEALTGTIPDEFRGEYTDAGSARSRLRGYGCQNLAELFARALPEIPLAFASRGDIGIADYPGAIIGGGVVVVGLDLIGKGHEGLVRLPRAALARAFKVE
jgi:hypothetical protein